MRSSSSVVPSTGISNSALGSGLGLPGRDRGEASRSRECRLIQSIRFAAEHRVKCLFRFNIECSL